MQNDSNVQSKRKHDITDLFHLHSHAHVRAAVEARKQTQMHRLRKIKREKRISPSFDNDNHLMDSPLCKLFLGDDFEDESCNRKVVYCDRLYW